MKFGTPLGSRCLWERMAQAMENGSFCVRLAAIYSSMFVEMYWGLVDSMYYRLFILNED